MNEVKEKETQQSTVLVVDDGESDRTLTSLRLKKLGVAVLLADSAEAGQAELKEGNFSHIIVDGLNGRWREVVETAKAEGIPNTNIFVFSGNFELKPAVEEAGIEFIEKGPGDSARLKEIFTKTAS